MKKSELLQKRALIESMQEFHSADKIHNETIVNQLNQDIKKIETDLSKKEDVLLNYEKTLEEYLEYEQDLKEAEKNHEIHNERLNSKKSNFFSKGKEKLTIYEPDKMRDCFNSEEKILELHRKLHFTYIELIKCEQKLPKL